MNVTGIIAEYNPFHNGHAYHLQESRKLTHADFLLVVMGGNFMQRGEPAVIDKYARASMALQGGADLVIELPTAFATGSAEFFAEGAIEILHASGVVTDLSFGSESGDLSLLAKTADLLLTEPPAFQEALKNGLRQGLSYPSAREQALRSCLTEPVAEDFFSSPNNILGIEYLKALKKRKSAIRPHTILRKGNYHGDVPEDPESFASASAIRNGLKNLPADLSVEALLPLRKQLSQDAFFNLVTAEHLADLEDFAGALHYRLFQALDPLEFADYLDVSEDLSRRIFSLRNQFTGYNAFIDLVKTRQYTRSRVARALLHILLDIRTSEVTLPSELRVLGFKKSAAPLLSAIKKQSRFPLITKLPKDGSLDPEIRRSALYHLGRPYEERQQKIILLNR